MPSDEQGQTLNGSSVRCMVGSPTGGRGDDGDDGDDDDDDDDDDAGGGGDDDADEDQAEVDLLKISKRRLKETTHVCHLCTLERLWTLNGGWLSPHGRRWDGGLGGRSGGGKLWSSGGELLRFWST